MNLILTGCAGFIGINFLKELYTSKEYKKYNNITSIDKMGYATVYNKNVYLDLCIKMDIDIVPFSAKYFSEKSPEYFQVKADKYGKDFKVIDFCSESHVDNSIDKPFSIFHENSMIPAYIILHVGLDNISEYFHISTDEIYGDIDPKYLNDENRGWFYPSSQIKPSNPYSASKAAQDMYLQSMAHTFGLNLKIIRMANQFGPHQHHEKMIPASIKRVLNGEPIKIYGNGENYRQWTFVKHTVQAILDITETKKLFMNDIIHIADDNYLLNNNELVEILVSRLKMFGYNPQIQYIEDRKGHDRMYRLKVIQNVQKYFTTNISKSIYDTIDHYIGELKNG
jgi:dTDP-glucose 4,6-dehydratase